MPTPFTHLAITQKLLKDPLLRASYRDLIAQHLPAFQLGSIVADARVSSGIGREVTHFYTYDNYMVEHPWQVMLNDHPSLQHPHNEEHLIFLAGYVAHLATDEAWALKMMRPQFATRDWQGVSRMDKFTALHLLLTHMDERDEEQLQQWQVDSLARCIPDEWLPFMSDDVIIGWRDLIVKQIIPTGRSQTLDIFSKRLFVEPKFLRKILDDPTRMTKRLWQYVPQAYLANVETLMYAYTRNQLQHYLIQYS